ncbi:2Fe-2S iron-sulfur cluster-binding protein [Streptomyces leeuwenhoekii]|uniref:2Fe-2S iron-sulfur cluster-binding protein n=1 Tax=Streptomyces leeuwenhoekii TaxID=1437453 RepID=UPI00368DCA00
MTDDQHAEGMGQGGGRWDPLPQGDYDDGATAFVELPEGGIDALLAAADSPLAAPGHGYVPPRITVAPTTPAATDPAATGPWAAPDGGAQWHAPDAPEGGYPHQDAGYGQHGQDAGYPQDGGYAQGGDGGYPHQDAGYGQHGQDAGYPQGFDGGYEQDPDAGYRQGEDAGYPYGAPAGYRQHDPYGVAGRQDGAQYDPHAGPQYVADDRFTYHPGATGQWDYAEAAAQEDTAAAAPAPAPGHDVTGQWSIPVAGGDLPDESGEFTTSSLVEQWGGAPPATLPGGAPAPWAPPAAEPRAHGDEDPAADHFAGHGGRQGAAPVAPEHGFAPYPEDAGEAVEQPEPELEPEPEEPGVPEEPGQEPGAPDGQLPPQDSPEPAEEMSAPAAAPGAPEGWQGAEQPDGSPGMPSQAQDAPGAAEAQDAVADIPDIPGVPDGADAPDTPEDSAAGETPDARDGQDAQHAHDAHDAQYAHDGQHAPGAQDAVPVPEGPAEPFAAPVAAQDAQAAPEAEEAAPEAAEAPEAPETSETPGAATGPDAPADAADGPDPAAGTDPADPSAGTAPAPEEESPADASAEPAEEPAAAPVAHDEHPLASYVLRVNGTDRPVTDAWIGESLLYVLRERLGLAGAKDGCSQGECGACNVQVDGRLVASCLVPAATAAGSEVRTVEGLAADGQPSDVQRALARCGAVQCGFCVPGMAMTVHDLLEGNPAPTELEARQALCGNLCRCSGYRGVLRAVEEVVAERGAHSAADASEADGGRTRVPHQAGPEAGGAEPSPFDPPEAPGPHDQPYGQDGGHA